jgi:transcriptional regulator of acetoin/glycerol metabolism
MDEPRFVDLLRELAASVLHEAGAPAETSDDLADELVRRVCSRLGGEKYWIHRNFDDRSKLIEEDNRPVSVVASETGVSRMTIYRRRRQISRGVDER